MLHSVMSLDIVIGINLSKNARNDAFSCLLTSRHHLVKCLTIIGER
jgi:hypothetical protein